MSLKALVIDDDPDIIAGLNDILASLGYTFDSAATVDDARRLLDNEYAFALLDLEIPVRKGGLPRIQNGQNLHQEIRERFAFRPIPIIVMTAHGTDGPELAVEMMKDGAADYVTKPFPSRGRTLDRAIREALQRFGRTDGRAEKRHGKPTPFTGGELILYANRIELSGVDIPVSRQMGKILTALAEKRSNGQFVAFSGLELADRIGAKRGQNGIAECVRDFRAKATDKLLHEANKECAHDGIIKSGGRGSPGYRLNSWIVVRDGMVSRSVSQPLENESNRDTNDTNGDTKNDTNDTNPRRSHDTNDTNRLTLNERQSWVLSELKKGAKIQVGNVVAHFACSIATAKRDLSALKDADHVEFVGPTRTGHYRLKPR